MASGAIKGITVEIGGDTTKLGKAIGESEKQSRSLQTELRQVERLLKFDPTNTELLTQKQGVLNGTITETSNKLDTLKEAEAQVIAQFERGEIAEEQLRAFQREIIRTEKDLNSMKTELSNTETALKKVADGTDTAEKHTKEYKDSVEKAKKELSEFKDNAGEAFDTLKTGATVLGGAVVATGGYALKLSTDFDKAFNTLITKTGASTEEMDSLNEAMENVYANNFGESIEDVAESMATVKTNTKLSGEELQKTTESALLLRDTFDFEVNESTRSAKMLMDQYGISADEAFNLIAQGAQNGLDKNGDLLDTVNEYAVHFKQLGIDAPTMFNMLSNGAESGTFSVDKLGDAVKEFGVRVKDGSTTTAEGFSAIGLDADGMAQKFAQGGDNAKDALSETVSALFNLTDPIAQNTAGVNLFGTMWEDLGVEGVKALMNLEGEVSTSKDALDTINNQKYDDIGSALQGLGRTLETDVIAPLGEDLTPVVEDVIEIVKSNAPEIKEVLSTVVSKIGEFVGFIVDNGTEILSVIAGVGTGFLVWNVVSMITGVVKAIKAFKLANEGATVAQWAMNVAMNANPIGILITLIAGILVAIVAFIATNDDARAKFTEIWNKIKEVFSNVIGAIVNFFTETIPNAFNSVVSFFQSLPAKIQTAISNLVSIVSDVFTNVKNTIFSVAESIYNNLPGGFQLVVQNIQTIFDNMVTIFQNVFGIIKTVVETVIAVIKAIFTGDFGSIPGIVSGALEKIKGFFGNILDAIVTIIINWIAMVINYFRGIGESLGTIFTKIGETIASWWQNIINFFTVKIPEIIGNIVTWLSELPGKIWNAIIGAVTSIANWGLSMQEKAREAVTNLVSSVITTVKELPGKIWNAIVSAVTNMVTWGNDMKTKAKGAMSDMVSNIVDTVKELPGKFLSIGGDIISGLWKGISGAVSGLYDNIKNALGGLVDKAKDALGIHSPSRVFADVVGKQIPAGIAKGINDNTGVADEAVEDMTDDLTNQAVNLNGATINRKLSTTFNANAVNDGTMADVMATIREYGERLIDASKRQIVLDNGTLIGESMDIIDSGLANKQLLRARGV